MKKNIYSWVWKWHFVGGIISLPFIILLSITGIIYLFKDTYEADHKKELKEINVTANRLSFEEQLVIAQNHWSKPLTAMILPVSKDESTEFVSGRFSHKSSIFVDPYTGEVKGKIIANQTDMHAVRKLHGELLLGKYGTKVVELIASWMVVLIITGVFLFLPRERGWKGLFVIRWNQSKRMLFRDIHGVLGFWFSLLLLIILAGGLPWTDVWGSSFKWIQKTTNTGFPNTWQGRMFTSRITTDKPLSLDQMVLKSRELGLVGEVSISLPKSPQSVFSISNQTTELTKMSMYHFDQYSGELLHHDTWSNIGFLMKIRLWMMAFHQGQFGYWNFILVFIVALALLFMSVSALFSYVKRKKAGEWGIPVLNKELKVGYGIVTLVMFLGVFLPLFGVSLVFIMALEKGLEFRKER